MRVTQINDRVFFQFYCPNFIEIHLKKKDFNLRSHMGQYPIYIFI